MARYICCQSISVVQIKRVSCTANKSTLHFFPQNPDFQRPWEISLLTTLFEKEKMLLFTIVSFPHNL